MKSKKISRSSGGKSSPASDNKHVRQPKTTGILAREVVKSMADKHLEIRDLVDRSHDSISEGTLGAIRRGTYIPSKLTTLDTLALLMGRSPEDFRLYALMDSIARELERYQKTWKDIYRQLDKEQFNSTNLPVFAAEEIGQVLNSSGFPAKEPLFYMPSAIDYGAAAYCLLFTNRRIFSKIAPGEIAILSAHYPPSPMEDYGVLGTKKNGIVIGKILTEHRSHVIVETNDPYDVIHVPSKDLHFLHRVVGMHRPDPQSADAPIRSTKTRQKTK